MLRRSFLVWAGAGGLAAAGGVAGYQRWQEITPRIHYPGRAEGHALRDRAALPPPSRVIDTDVAILGSGIAGMAAAWKLRKLGHRGALMIDGPQPYGNAAGGRFGDLAYPTGAHYLPLPPPEAVHVREILADIGVIQHDALGEKPVFDERWLLHAPHERVLYQGKWQEGVLPHEGVPEAELAEHRRFFAEVERLRMLRGSDGRRIFVIPAVLSSDDARWRALDAVTFKRWLDLQGYRSPTLLWYLNYCCRDDYGSRYDQVSAWAGLHYFCSRWGGAANAQPGTWLTWPGGLQPVASAMERSAGIERMAGTAVNVRQVGEGVEVLCFAPGTDEGAPARTYLVKARKAICAMPLYVATRTVENIAQYGFDPARDTPLYAPWLVANFLLKRFPHELRHGANEAPLSWDNVVHRPQSPATGLETGPETEPETGLGYVVSTHQDIRVTPPEKTVFSAYVALSNHNNPSAARRFLTVATPAELLALAGADLHAAYGQQFTQCVERVDITLRGHAMAAPLPGFRDNRGVKALRELDGPILFAHADLSGFSIFEEAAWWGCRAAQLAARYAK